jgi:hypothetical protein
VADARMILGMIVILVGSKSWAYTYENYLEPYSQGRGSAAGMSTETSARGTLTKKIQKPKKSEETISLIIPSMVIHGIAPSKNAIAAMPRKQDGDGRMVQTPGFGLEYKAKDGFMLLGAAVKDCFDNLAGALQIGESFSISDRSSWGLTFGVYMRETPIACETAYNYGSAEQYCYQLDNYSAKFMTRINGHLVDIMPMPFFHFRTALFKSPEFQIDFKLMSNVILNEFGIAVPF